MKKRLYLTLNETPMILAATNGARDGLRDRCLIITVFYMD